MSWLRIRTPDGRNLDRDLGESGHTGRGYRFDTLWHTDTPARVAKPLPPRCEFPLRDTGYPCQRIGGHTGKHQGRPVKRPCACGGFVCADPRDPTAGVMAHRAVEPHRSWSAREYPLPIPTAIRRRDMSVRRSVRPGRREVLVGLGYEL